jgi:pimeloyl-ACP methyl ester carboxylesterase
VSEQIYLFHGKGGSPNGSVSILERELRPLLPHASFTRPQLLHHDPNVLAEDSLAALDELQLPVAAVVIGVSLGGLIAARLQEATREDLTVVCISSPTWADQVKLQRRMQKRVSFYSSADDVIQGRTAQWPSLAQAYDVRTLSHDTDRHAQLLARLTAAYLKNEDVSQSLPG